MFEWENHCCIYNHNNKNWTYLFKNWTYLFKKYVIITVHFACMVRVTYSIWKASRHRYNLAKLSVPLSRSVILV